MTTVYPPEAEEGGQGSDGDWEYLVVGLFRPLVTILDNRRIFP